METAIIIIILRLVVPLMILRFPVTGTLAAAFLDVIDHNFIGAHGWYQSVDKLLDIYYLSFCAHMVFKWKELRARQIALSFYVLRLVGTMLLLVTQAQWLLFFFPNLFEPFFIFYLLFVRLTGGATLITTRWIALGVGAAIAIPKVIQEYSLHVHVKAPELTPPLLAALFASPKILTALLWLTPPTIALAWCVMWARKASTPPDMRPRR